MSKRVRIKDIAKKAGVSKGTVDRVIHERGNVSADAKERVLQAMEELGYERNILASALAYNRTLKVAAILPRPEEDPFWAQPKSGIDRALQSLRDYGMTVDFYTFKDADRNDFDQQAKKLLSQSYDAVLVAPIFLKESSELLDKFDEMNIKYVLINTHIERTDKGFLCYIGQDSYYSGVLAAKLLNFGLPKGAQVAICHLEKAVYNSQHLIQKEKGFEDFFKQNSKNNIQVVKLKFEEVLDHDGLKAYIQQQLHPGLQGIFVTTSKGHYIATILKELGREDIKLVGFDLIEENLKYLNDGVIDFLINQNPLKQGYLAMINIFNHFILKKEVKKMQHLPLDIVMPENVEYYLETDEKLHMIF